MKPRHLLPFRLCLGASLALRLTIACAGPLASGATDEDELTLVYGDNDSVSIATGSVQALRRAPAVASVITAADIAAMGATDLDQVLESVPGMHVNRAPNSYTPLYVVRGIVTQLNPQMLVLQNGVPVTTAYIGNKGNLWGGYPLDHVARIEIIRGPGSALYGSDAFSGVINIITKAAADTPGTEIGARAGSFETADAWIQHGGKAAAVDVAAYVRVGQSDGFKSIIDADAQTRNDALFGTHASLAPGPLNTGYRAVDGNLDLGWGHWRARAGYKRRLMSSGAGIASALDPVGRGLGERITTSLAWADPQFSRDWGLGASVNTMQYLQDSPVDYVLLPPGARLPTGVFPDGMIGGPDTKERQLRLTAFADYGGWSQHRVRIGAGHDDVDMYYTHETRNFTYSPGGTPVPLPGIVDFSSSNPFVPPERRKINYLFLQDEWNLSRDWNLTAGVRHDHYSDFGGTTNPRLALVWDASFDLTAKLMYGRAFRAPSFNESYSIANPVVIGNPNLRPEKNGTLEASFAWQAGTDAQLNLTLYRYEMTDIIRTRPNAIPGTGATYANAGDQEGHGVELEGIWNPTRTLRVSGNYAWQKSTDETNHVDAGYAPHDHLYGRADWQFSSGYLMSSQVNWVAGRKRAFGDARPTIADYTTLDLSLSTRRGRDRWNFTLAARNLFNADVREPSQAPGLSLPHDLPMAPRAVTLQAVYRM